MRDEIEGIFVLVILTILSLLVSCILTQARIDDVIKRVDTLEQKITPVKTPEQLKLEELEKQLKELTKKED